MNYQELLSSGANVSVTLSPSDLINLLKEINTISKTEILEPESEEFISRKNALALLKSQPFGGRKRYKKSDLELIRTGKKGR